MNTISQRSADLHIPKWVNNPTQYAILDTETTGFDRNAQIIEIAVLRMDGKVLLDKLIKSTKPIPKRISELTGITNEDMKYSHPWPSVRWQLNEIARQHTLLIYNASFDKRMIQQTDRLHNTGGHSGPTDCVMKAVSRHFGHNKRMKLDAACKRAGVALDLQSHRALDDCFLVHKLIHALAQQTL